MIGEFELKKNNTYQIMRSMDPSSATWVVVTLDQANKAVDLVYKFMDSSNNQIKTNFVHLSKEYKSVAVFTYDLYVVNKTGNNVTGKYEIG